MSESIIDKINSLSPGDRLIFDQLATDFSENLTLDTSKRLLELGLIEKNKSGNLVIPWAVHIAWCEMCFEELEED